MTPYYQDRSVTLYHGDCREILPVIGVCDVVLTDPPYDTQTHAGARTLDKETRERASDGRRAIEKSARLAIDFDPLDVVQTAPILVASCRRWMLAFCGMEMLGEYRRVLGDAYIRGGFWRRIAGTPQVSGDRPAQPGEAIAICHHRDGYKGAMRWNGGGHPAFFQHAIVKSKRERCHPTQKPESLMIELVLLFSDAGETICDPFAGSGTTLVAAKRLGRLAVGCELDEQWCEEAARRLSQESLLEPHRDQALDFAESVPAVVE